MEIIPVTLWLKFEPGAYNMGGGICGKLKSRSTSGFWTTERTTKGSLCLDFSLHLSCSPFSYINIEGRKEAAKHVISRVLFISKGCNKTEALRRKRVKSLPLSLALAPKSQSCFWLGNSWDLGEGEHLPSDCSGSGTTESCTQVTSFNLHSNPEELPNYIHTDKWRHLLRVYTLRYSIMHF